MGSLSPGTEQVMATVAPARSTSAPQIHRITVDEYDRIGDSGALEEPHRIELIDGYLVDKMPKNPGHSYSCTEALAVVGTRLPSGWFTRVEQPIRIPDFDEPEPDISILREPRSDYRRRHPTPDDVAMLIEVSDSSLAQDRGIKRTIYARAGIAVYWIINLVERQVEVYSRPTKDGRYRSRRDFKPGQSVPIAIDGQKLPPIPVDDLLP